MDIINIDSLAYGGYGVGRLDSKVFFVDYAVPGDILKIEIFDEHKNYAFGRIIEIINPSLQRIAPECKHFGICGGCNYLNMPYRDELYWKMEIFKTGFKKTFGNTADIKDVNLLPDIAAGNFLNYRQKISLKISNSYIGFYKKLSHQVIDVDYCCLANEGVNGLLKNVRNLLLSKNHPNELLNKLAKVTLADAGLKNIIFGFKSPVKSDILNAFAADTLNKLGADNVFIELPHKKILKFPSTGNGLKDKKNKAESCFILKDKKFSYDLPSFIQINKVQNENIIGIVTDYIKNFTENRGGIKFKNALDLYCGFGNISIFLSAYAKSLTGVDSNGFSIKLGEKNIELNEIKNIELIKSDTEVFLQNANMKNAEYDLVVLDPPRAGIKGLVPKVAKLNPSLAIYISCDTMTFLRDLKVFAETGYKIKQINLADMFPRTYHMEHVAFLSR